jgi:hypothetical protein
VSSTSPTLRRQLRRYLSDDLTLKQFVRWLAPRMASSNPASASDELVNEIYIRVAEFTNGDWTESELKQLLRPSS